MYLLTKNKMLLIYTLIIKYFKINLLEIPFMVYSW